MNQSTQYALVIDSKVIQKGSAKRIRSAKNAAMRDRSITGKIEVWISHRANIGDILK